MFKIFIVLCVAGSACIPMSETNKQTYATEKACWSVLTKKMEMLPNLAEDPNFKSLTAACIKDE